MPAMRERPPRSNVQKTLKSRKMPQRSTTALPISELLGDPVSVLSRATSQAGPSTSPTQQKGIIASAFGTAQHHNYPGTRKLPRSGPRNHQGTRSQQPQPHID